MKSPEELAKETLQPFFDATDELFRRLNITLEKPDEYKMRLVGLFAGETVRVRDEALEDAAKKCDESAASWAPLRSLRATDRRCEAIDLAEAIRALKTAEDE